MVGLFRVTEESHLLVVAIVDRSCSQPADLGVVAVVVVVAFEVVEIVVVVVVVVVFGG